MTKNQVCDLFHISRSTIERRMKDGTYKFTKVGRSVSFSRSDLGLPELPSSKPPAIPLPYQDEQPTSIHCEPKHIRPMSDIEKKQASDQAFAARYLTGSATDSMGNRFDGTNDTRPTAGAAALVPKAALDYVAPADTQAHINPALLSSNDNSGNPIEKYHKDWHGGEPYTPEGFTDKGVALAPGFKQSDYDAMMAQYRSRFPGARSEAEFEKRQRHDVKTILAFFPKG